MEEAGVGEEVGKGEGAGGGGKGRGLEEVGVGEEAGFGVGSYLHVLLALFNTRKWRPPLK